MTRGMQGLVAATLWLAGAMGPATAGAAAPQHDAAEAIFRAARSYTVRVRTEITLPFAEDERGAFQGAGFVVDAKRGWILTNAHVVCKSPSTVRVAFADGPWLPAHKVYVDSFSDMAIIAIHAPAGTLHAATLERVEVPSVGENIGAFGHPLGMLFTGSRGIVSGRTDQCGPDLMQIDATVNAGNSGGPVIRLRDGRVVGIATAGAKGQKNDRINFATPLKDVCRILDLLARGVAPNPQRMPFALLENEDGSQTLEVGATFDRERWPLEPMDRIVAVAGEPGTLKTQGDLVTALRGRTGDVKLVVERGGHEVEVVVRPEREPSVVERRALVIDGAMIAPTDLYDAALFTEMPPFMVQSVEPGSVAEGMMVGVGDLVDSVDGQSFTTLESLAAHLERRAAGKSARVVLRRWSGSTHKIFDYLVREFPAEQVEMVGADGVVAKKE